MRDQPCGLLLQGGFDGVSHQIAGILVEAVEPDIGNVVGDHLAFDRRDLDAVAHDLDLERCCAVGTDHGRTTVVSLGPRIFSTAEARSVPRIDSPSTWVIRLPRSIPAFQAGWFSKGSTTTTVSAVMSQSTRAPIPSKLPCKFSRKNLASSGDIKAVLGSFNSFSTPRIAA
jgi:hypothetical protein